jgi:hypothetical protein
MHASDPRDFLAIYLRDHHAAGRAGVALARRASASVSGPGRHELLSVAREIEQDLSSLESIMDAVGVSTSAIKDTLAAVAERVGRLKGNGRSFERSRLSDVFELEMLVAGITAKEALWRSLTLAQISQAELGGADLEQLIERARRQRETVENCRQAAAKLTFVSA